MIAAITSYRARNKAEDNVIRKLRRALFSHQFLNFDVWIELHFHRLFFKKEMNKFYPTKKARKTFLYGFFFVFVLKCDYHFHTFFHNHRDCWLEYVIMLSNENAWDVLSSFSCFCFFFTYFSFYPCWQSDVVAPNLIPNFHYRSFHFLFTPPPPPPTIPFIVLRKFVNRLSY